MKISADGGSLCQPANGNFTFTKNFLKAISLYDIQNQYDVYTFCSLKKNNEFNKNITFRKLRPKLGWMKIRVGMEEIFNSKEIFLALNQASPLFGQNKIISFCHGLSYYYFPNYYKKNELSRLNSQLRQMVNKSDEIVVSSIKIEKELVSVFPNLKNIVVIPYGIPFDVVQNEQITKRERSILALGYGQPIKNIDFIIRTFKKLQEDKKYSDYRLYLIGKKNDKKKEKNIIVINNIKRQDLLKLYSNSALLLTTSFYESYNFPVIEALASGCNVVGLKSAIIPEMEKYVELANNEGKFVDKIKESLSNPEKISYDSLKEEFSWVNYINKLKKLYI